MAEHSNPQVKLVKIHSELAGQRIDNFLMAQLRGVPKSHIYQILRKGEVRVNKGRKKAHYKLQEGDEVRIPPVRVSKESEQVVANPGLLQRLQDAILFEDEMLLVINKPAGLAVHGGSGIDLGVIEAFRQLRPECKYLELAHRLDRSTSGCLILAKKRSALKSLHEHLRNNQWEKQYVALVKGKWQGGARVIDLPLLKNTLRSGERVVRVSDEGKQAVSKFSPIACGENWSLLRIRLLTGRTHQIRVHGAHVGHPIAGDERYGDKAFNQWVKQEGCKRMFLHAYSISVRLPELDRHLKVSAPLDTELQKFLKHLGCKSEFTSL